MKRPMRWYWAALISGAVYYVIGATMDRLTFGSVEGEPLSAALARAPLSSLRNWLDYIVSLLLDPFTVGARIVDPRCYVEFLMVAMPAFLGGLAVFRLLRQCRRSDEYLHCPRCTQILKGLTEPRCPECGERI